MKIVAIRGRNLASLEGEFAIDFSTEPLLSAGIFTISGPTGAGKSTILDAMCLALFARTPRTEQAKENNVKLRDVQDELLLQSDPRFILRRGTASGYAEVDFMALNGQLYRARWSVVRAREKEDGRLQFPRHSLLNVETGKEEQGTRSELLNRIVELIGLTFDQFTRSVLLAQNDFSTFLKAEQGDKASLLEKLTGTELYSAISRMIYEKNTLAKEKFERVQARIHGIELLTEEAEQALQKQLREAETTLSVFEKVNAELRALQEAVRLAEREITRRQMQQKEANNQLTRANELLDNARKAYEKGLLDEQRADTKYKAMQQELQQARKLDIQLETLNHSVKESEARLRKAIQQQKEGEAKWETTQKKQAIASQKEQSLIKQEQILKAEQIDTIDEQIEAVRNQRETLLIEQARQKVGNDIMELRKQLQEGQPCPVCGSTQHPATSYLQLTEMQQQIAAFTLQLKQLTTRKEAYALLEKQRQQVQREQSALQAECESVASFLPTLRKEASEATEWHEQNKKSLSALQTEREKLLSGRSADQVEQAYTQFVDKLKAEMKRLQAVQTEQSAVVDRLKGMTEQLEKDVAKASKELVQHQQALNKWTTAWNRHHPEESLADLLARTQQEKNESLFRLRTNEENRRKIAGQQKELEECRLQSERWAKLNELAGSADGGKFRRIAQQYTLDILLNYANVQLRDLTRRYRLERVPDTLALQVIDRDMCDEVRTVHSLSGGESFLVSLALALGLSSLSSNRMRVESLFIDEGFGSLDAETLRVAMDALESLRTQGRKIGVISHVQEMTERIPVQIRVNRIGTGKSSLNII